MNTAEKNIYAGFWRRAFAFFVDLIIVFLAVSLGWIAYSWAQMFQVLLQGLEVQRDSLQLLEIILSFLAYDIDVESFITLQMSLTAWGLWLIFTAAFESSAWQATPGKRLIGIKVTDYEGRRVEFPQALWRNFAKIFSDMTLCIGYVLAGITRHKQALHDMIAQCLVVKAGERNKNS